MKPSLLIILALVFALVGPAVAAPTARPETNLAQSFVHPPVSAKPLIWWHWLNGNVTKAGITADLESMARVGIAGATIINVANKAAVNIPAGPVDYLSPQWLDLLDYSAREAERLGLQLSLANCAGWSGSGGPWITPENSMKKVVWSEFGVVGPTASEIKLVQPSGEMNFYRDIAVLAFPMPKPLAVPVAAANRQTGKAKPQSPEAEAGQARNDAPIALESVLDLTGKMDATGRLDWQPPTGHWTVLRLGYTTNGKMIRPAPESATGLECDKLSRSALDAFWAGGIRPILDKLGPLAGKVVNTILLDSFEAGTQNWTAAMGEEFLHRRGYELKRYLPALTGRVIDNRDQTARFMWDFNRTIADLFADNYYGYLADKCHQAGLLFACEPYGNGGFESLTAGARADLPMGEFWVNRGIHNSPKVAASVAHTQGRNIVGAESFTAQPEQGRWQNYPGSLKALGDLMWCHGINRYSFHCDAHQPWSNLRPGMTMGQWGTMFGRTNTWWEQSPAWMSYIARCQSLLQQGSFCADVLYFAGETPSNWPVVDAELRAAGYDYDLIGTDLVGQLRVEHGAVVLPSGMRYRLLALRKTQLMTPAIAAKVRDLVQAGATVIAERPHRSPSLRDYPQSDAQVNAIAEEVWGTNDTATGQRSFGQGRIIWGRTPLEELKQLAVAPDFKAPTPEAKLLYIHRQTVDADIYFVSHQGDETKMFDCFFRVTGRQPELWDPLTGEMRTAGLWRQEADGARVMLPLGPKSSLFVVFPKPVVLNAETFASMRGDTPDAQRLPELTGSPSGVQLLVWENGHYVLKTSTGRDRRLTVESIPSPLVVDQPWTVDFTPGWGAPNRIDLPQLLDWTKHSDPGVRYYSGTATYRTALKLPAAFVSKASRLELDLGQVKVLAEVILNGRNLGVVWCDPFRVDITKAAKAGDNTLEVRVTNLWPNRLIGDEQFLPDVEWAGKALKDWPAWLKEGQSRPSTNRLTFTTWHHWNKGDALLPSGLLGPVQVRAGELIEMTP